MDQQKKMESNELLEKYKDIIKEFTFTDKPVSLCPYGSGHINDTFLLKLMNEQNQVKKVILQRMNHHIFQKPVEVMENILSVTSFLRKKIEASGGDPDRETLQVITARDGSPFVYDKDGEYWRAYPFITDTVSYDKAENASLFYESAVSFGRFQYLLSDYPADTLHETIPDFHNTKARYKIFLETVRKDTEGRVGKVTELIAEFQKREKYAHLLLDQLAAGKLPLRVTHNDTKLNNIMMDAKTGKGICVIDLDTVMPGLSVNDFGDSIRFGANTALEDETDRNKIGFDKSLYDMYLKGYLEGCQGSLTEAEIKALPLGAMTMTFECGMRFLTDYLDGDHYFKIHRPDHNLDRAWNQMLLLQDMERKLV